MKAIYVSMSFYSKRYSVLHMHLRVSFNIHYSKGLFNRKCTGNMNMKSREAVDYNAELRRCLLKALLNVQVRHSSRPNVEKTSMDAKGRKVTDS